MLFGVENAVCWLLHGRERLLQLQRYLTPKKELILGTYPDHRDLKKEEAGIAFNLVPYEFFFHLFFWTALLSVAVVAVMLVTFIFCTVPSNTVGFDPAPFSAAPMPNQKRSLSIERYLAQNPTLLPTRIRHDIVGGVG